MYSQSTQRHAVVGATLVAALSVLVAGAVEPSLVPSLNRPAAGHVLSDYRQLPMLPEVVVTAPRSEA